MLLTFAVPVLEGSKKTRDESHGPKVGGFLRNRKPVALKTMKKIQFFTYENHVFFFFFAREKQVFDGLWGAWKIGERTSV